MSRRPFRSHHVLGLAILIALCGALLFSGTAAAFQVADQSVRKGIKHSERTTVDGFDQPLIVYLSTVNGRFAVNCTWRPGYTNTVFGRVFRQGSHRVKRGHKVRTVPYWRPISVFNIYNIESEDDGSPDIAGSAAEVLPPAVFTDFRNAIADCAAQEAAEW